MKFRLRHTAAPSVIIIVLDILVLIGAIAINILREHIPLRYTLTDTALVTTDPLDWYSVVIVAALAGGAVLTAVQVVLSVLKARSKNEHTPQELGGDIAFLVGGSAALLVVSVIVMLFSLRFSVPEKPLESHSYGYSNNNIGVVIVEEVYSDGIISANIFDITYDPEIELVYTFELSELSESAERYTLSWAATDILQILYTDADTVRTVQLNFALLHSEHDGKAVPIG